MGAAAAAATPTPSPSPTDLADVPLPENSGFGFGIADLIAGQINSWFAGLVTMAVKPLLDLLAVTLLATPDVSGSGRVFDLWKVNAICCEDEAECCGTEQTATETAANGAPSTCGCR